MGISWEMKDSQRVLMIGGMVVASGAAGFALGKARTPVAVVSEPAPSSATGVARRTEATRSRELEADPIRAFERLLAGKGEFQEIGAVVSRIPPAKVPELAARLREAVADPPDGADPAFIQEIARAMYFRWAEADPQAALQDAGKWPVELERYIMSRPALAAGVKRDGVEGYLTMKKDSPHRFHTAEMLVRTWSNDDLLENLKRLPDQAERDHLLSRYCEESAEVPEKREAMIRLLHERKDLTGDGSNFNRIFRAWSNLDFDAAMLSAGKQGVEGLEDEIIDATMNVEAGKAMPAAVARGMKPGPSWEDGYENWCNSEPEAAKAWLSGQMSAWNEGGHQNTVANFLTKQLERDTRTGKSVDREASAKRLSSHWEEWRAKDAKAAEQWLEAAKPEVRENISGKGGEQ